MGGDNPIIKFLYSYGGKILPRRTDGKLRYAGGHTRVLAVDRSISYSELVVKLEELCGSSVSLKFQLPSEDLDVLVTVSSDEELANVIEEYDRVASCSKIRVVLLPLLSPSSKTVSPPSSSTSSVDSSEFRSVNPRHSRRSASPTLPSHRSSHRRSVSPSLPINTAYRCCGCISPPIDFVLYHHSDAAKLYCNPCHVGGTRGNPRYYHQ